MASERFNVWFPSMLYTIDGGTKWWSFALRVHILYVLQDLPSIVPINTLRDTKYLFMEDKLWSIHVSTRARSLLLIACIPPTATRYLIKVGFNDKSESWLHDPRQEAMTRPASPT